MFRTCAFALSLSLAAAPVLALNFAEDYADDYAAAVRPFLLPGASGLRSIDQLAGNVILAVLPTLEGDWVEVGNLYPEPFNPLSFRGNLVGSKCERAPVTLVQTSSRNFDLGHVRPGEGGATMTVHYSFLFGNSFDRSVREEDVAGLPRRKPRARPSLTPGLTAGSPGPARGLGGCP